ncbi:hypothetical protein [Streptomyces sp. bgisy027]|uniref:hypothetical protein n=1 Tax=Streptomyces sp. bgisy027 TaxID=3413770 RepID=UPI003D71A4FA
MIAYEQLYHLDVDGIRNAVDSWSEYIRRYDSMGEAYDQQVVTNFDQAGWTSLDGTALYARSQIVMANKEFIDAVTEAKGIRAVLQDAYDELRKYKSDLHQLKDDAKSDNITITATGQVTLTQPDPDGDKPVLPGGALAPLGPSVNQLKIEFWEAKIAVVLAAADNADISASHALRRNTGKGGDEGFNDKTVKSVDQDEAQQASKLLKKYENGEKLSPAELNELDRLMSHNQKDPEFSRMLLKDLGPEGTLRLAEDLEHERGGDGANKDKYNDIQRALANNIATANQDKAFSDQWRADMRALGTEPTGGDHSQPYGYQTLTTLLKHGDTADYPPRLTTGLTDDIIAAEKKHPGIWDEGKVVPYGDDPEPQAVVDPVDDMLGIMSGDPDTATKYLDPEQDGSKDRLKYLLDDRHWPNVHVREDSQGAAQGTPLDEYDQDATNSRTGLGSVLEAATTGGQPGEEKTRYEGHTEGQARVMQETIQRLDNYGHGGGDEIPENMQTPLARALSDYTPDTHNIIAGTQDGYVDPNGRKNILGSGDDAHIAVPERSVIRVLRGVSEDPENYAQIYESERFYAADQMARADKEPGNGNENWEVPAVDAGNVLGAYNAIGSDAYLDARDEKKQWADDAAKSVYHGAGLPLTAVPWVGDGAQRMLDQETYDWSKDVKAVADARANDQTAAEKADGVGSTQDLITRWDRDRSQSGQAPDDRIVQQMRQQTEQGYITSRESAFEDLRGRH